MHGLSQEDSSLTISEVDFESYMRWESGLAFGEFGDISETIRAPGGTSETAGTIPVMTPVEWGVTHDADTLKLIVFKSKSIE